MNFLGSKCGAGGRTAGKMGGAKYGLPIKKDGSCGHLVDNECSIYDNRPIVCNVKKLGEKVIKSGSKLTLKEWYIYNSKLCNKMIDDDGLDKVYKIDINEYN